MPRASGKTCSALGGTCSNLALPGHARCEIHEKQKGRADVRRGRNPWDWVWHDPRWKRLAAHTLREEPTCRKCGAPSEVADHIVELADGGAPFSRSNTQGLCNRCNVGKGQKAAQARRLREQTPAHP